MASCSSHAAVQLSHLADWAKAVPFAIKRLENRPFPVPLRRNNEYYSDISGGVTWDVQDCLHSFMPPDVRRTQEPLRRQSFATLAFAADVDLIYRAPHLDSMTPSDLEKRLAECELSIAIGD